MTLDKKLARLRKKAGLSQAEVSEEMDVSRQAVTKWETGQSRPSTENLQSLSKLYNVPLEYLLDESEDELPAPAPAAPDAESGTESEAQKKEKRWIRKLVIGTVVLLVMAVLLTIFTIRNWNSVPIQSMADDGWNISETARFSIGW